MRQEREREKERERERESAPLVIEQMTLRQFIIYLKLN